MNAEPLIQVDNLTSRLLLARGTLVAVDGVSLHVDAGEAVGVVGESGSGKSMLAQTLLGLLPAGVHAEFSGRLRWHGREFLPSSPTATSLRGPGMTMVFQDPSTALHPFVRVGRQLQRILALADRARAGRDDIITALRDVGITEPELRMRQYPHQLSGGMRQRVAMAMAMAWRPTLLIADEPTTALDVTIQRQIVDLLQRSRVERGMALVFITHDLHLAGELCDRIYVMYAGRIVESGPAAQVLQDPQHPYTKGLVGSMTGPLTESRELVSIPGNPPDPLARPVGCPFHPRCPMAFDRCRTERPETRPAGQGRSAACWLIED